MSVFSERLTAMLKTNKLSQKAFAKKIRITESALSHYTNGTRTPSGDVLVRIAQALNTSADYLLGSTDNVCAPDAQEKLKCLQKSLEKLNAEQLKKALTMLNLMFDDVFDDAEME